MTKVAASILAADILNMEHDVRRILSAGADMLHVDIMDAHFVPNLSFGPAIVESLRKCFSDVILDVHLMMDNPELFIKRFRNAGADAITVHYEVAEDLISLLGQIKESGARCGVSLKPGTQIDKIRQIMFLVDIVLIMSVEPGFGGQHFMPEALQKIADLRKTGYTGEIAVDGGVGAINAPLLVNSGADVLVMGASLFSSDDPKTLINLCHKLEGTIEKIKS